MNNLKSYPLLTLPLAFLRDWMSFVRDGFFYFMKLIPLTQGKFAMVDDDMYDYLMQWKWYAHRDKNTFYAVRNLYLPNRKRIILGMHRLIMGFVYNDGKLVDHKDRNGLNNQKSNLRLATNSQNLANSRNLKVFKSSIYIGVSYPKKGKKWVAQILINGKKIRIGRFVNEKDAALAYNETALKLRGEFAILNEIL